MIQEYLLQDNSEKNSIKTYNPSGINVRWFSASDGKCWYVQYSADSDNEETAKRLSEVDEYIVQNYHVTILENGVSAYFNKRLYPYVSGFEYKLRKLLYLTSAINHDDQTSANISNLESLDFGQLFTLLFIDNSFMSKVRDDIKNRNREFFSKAEVLAAIKSVDENTLWDDLLGKDSVPTLRNRFGDVRLYRNDVMHSHHLNYQKYKDVLAFFKTVNFELTLALEDIKVIESKASSKHNFNKALDEALRAQEQLIEISKTLNLSLFGLNSISDGLYSNPELLEAINNIREEAAPLMLNSELQHTIKRLTELKAEISPALQRLSELARSMTEQRIEIPPELLRLQTSLSGFSSFNDNDKEEQHTEEQEPKVTDESVDDGDKHNESHEI